MSPQQVPTILSIPAEILLSVLSLLSYGDLKKRIPLVCRKFHTLVQKPSPESATPVDITLWRDAPINLARNEYHVMLHPLMVPLQSTMLPMYLTYRFKNPCLSAVTVSRREFGTGDEFYKEKLRDSPLRFENACSPGVGAAEYHRTLFDGEEPGGGVAIKATGDGGRVTILDVMTAIVDAVKEGRWPEENPRHIARHMDYSWDGVKWADVVGGVLHLYDTPPRIDKRLS